MTDHQAFRALRQHPELAHRPVALLSSWPPPSLTLSGANDRTRFERAEMTPLHASNDWILWEPTELLPLPLFGLASVHTLAADGQKETCPRDDAGFALCGDARWMRPGPMEVEVGGRSSECIWAHPLPGRTLRITYPQVQARDERGRMLTLLTGLRDSSVGGGVPVDVSVQIGDQTLTHTHRDKRGWQALELPGVEAPSELTLEISSDNPGRRHFCYQFEYRP
ncbi:hypothetical protein [Lujinxingia litoralis]|uniref:hypothetical protein n=1 Tax=Lujinxingia litoralis TaxID=2211119 RepID=UPI0011B942AA|nr:hypothetical protein [Lujinxingia litoralis]